MFISLADAQGIWVVFFEDKNVNPRKVACWAIKEFRDGNRKVVPVVHVGGGKMVDANSIGKISSLLSGKNAQDKYMAEFINGNDNAPSKDNGQSDDQSPVISSWATAQVRPGQDPVPALEDEEEDQ